MEQEAADPAPAPAVACAQVVYDPTADPRAKAGLPPFTAECFFHYDAGGHYDWPRWLQPAYLRDARGLRPTDPAFNQSTLQVPDEETQKRDGHGTPMLKQYWKIKAGHFDKVALFKVGKFYEVFYYDAFIAQQVCGLKWMANEKKPHVGFPEMAKHQYAKLLVDAGYKVVVVEQVERVVENKERNAGAMSCIQREPCEVFTKGTTVDPEMIGGAGAKYMMFLHFDSSTRGNHFAACMVDCATSQFLLRAMADSADRNALRTLLARIQPQEVAYAVENIPADVLTMLRRLPCRPLLTPQSASVSVMAARDRLQKYSKDHPEKLSQAVQGELASELAVVAAAGAMDYLDSVLLGKRVLPFAIWDIADMPTGVEQPNVQHASSATGKRMVLDATALSALEIFETLEGTYAGSLLHFLDNTSTAFGHRLLKQWLCAPLLGSEEILTRQEAVEFFIGRRDLADQLRGGLKKVNMDLERVTAKVWGYALQSERHAVMYEDVTAKRLTEFAALLQGFEQCMRLLQRLPDAGLPARLQQIARTRAKGGVFPDLEATISRLSTSVVATGEGKNGVTKYRPRDGYDATYDELSRKLDSIKANLDLELQALRKKLPKATLTYVHRLPGYRYEVECDESALPADMRRQVDVTSCLKGRVRFQTSRIQQLVADLDPLEDRREDCIFPFLSRLFQEFYAHQAQFRAAVRLIAELDVLISLSAASQGLCGASCKPEIVDPVGPQQDEATLQLQGCRHPVAAARMGAAFVPNDTLLNAGGVPGILVVTGPNMGGKSTVLRQTCIAVVMAQLGCRVNATACRLSPVDRIFTRIGSYDTILEGKSTLLVELEETAAVLSHATRRSLAVLDELGRGTSTFDGAAIAAAVLQDIAARVHCLTLFATHYHPVSREAVRSPRIAPFHMAADVDARTHEMTFLYRFLPGLCPASHGHNVARLAGLPQEVLEEARRRSEDFEGSADGEAAHLVQLAEAGDGGAALRQYFREQVS